MGDAADDAYNAEMRAIENRESLLSMCPRVPPFGCVWVQNDEGLWDCETCGAGADL